MSTIVVITNIIVIITTLGQHYVSPLTFLRVKAVGILSAVCLVFDLGWRFVDSCVRGIRRSMMMSVPSQFFRASKSMLDVFDMELHIRSCHMNEFGCFLLPTWPFSVLFVNPKTIKHKNKTKRFLN